MEGIFISYRRDDSAGYAGRLYDRLAAHFGADAVFMDVEGIEPGTDFVKAIEGAVASCKVLIVLIGNQWLGATDAAGRRRLEDPHDFIRLETSTALARDIRVVPVLVDRAPMPLQEDLPEDLQSLVRRQAVELNHKQWDATSGELIKTLEKILNVAGPRSTGNAEAEQAGSSTPRAGKGRVLWIAATVLVAMVAGAAFWQLSPVETNRLPPPRIPLTEKSEPDEPSEPKVAGQSTTQAEAQPQTPVQPPEPYLPVPEESAKIVTDGIKPETAEQVSIPVNPPKVAETPAPIPASPPMVARPSPTQETPPKVAEPSPIQGTPPKVADPTPRPVNPPSVTDAAPIPIAPVKPKPERPPAITSLTANMGEKSVSICYQVERARKLRLTPMPGELQNSVKACVSVAPQKTTRYTLSATGPGGSASREISVPPHPGTLAEIARRERLPGRGELWVYQTRGKWPASPQWKFQISIDSSDNSRVSESLTILEPAAKAAGIRNSGGGKAGFVSWPDIGLEFSPWMGAYIEFSGRERWKDFATPAAGGRDGWYSSASTSQREQVEVHAGRFDAWKVESWSNRHATEGSTSARLEPVRIHFAVWYAPQVKRYVKSIRRVISASGQVLEEDLFELVEYKLN